MPRPGINVQPGAVGGAVRTYKRRERGGIAAGHRNGIADLASNTNGPILCPILAKDRLYDFWKSRVFWEIAGDQRWP